MVKELKHIPLVCTTAIAVTISFYGTIPFSFSFCRASRALLFILCLIAFLQNCILFSSSKNENASLLLTGICLLSGLGIGLICAWTVTRTRAPVTTLATREKITSVQVTLLSDPCPAGDRWYRAEGYVSACEYPDTVLFSADGKCLVYIPATIVREALPGGIGTGSNSRVLFSKGLTISFHGHFGRYNSETGDSFYVTNSVGMPTWSSHLCFIRAKLRLALMRVLYGYGDAGGLILALLSANRSWLSPTLAEDFRNAGLSYILALSGMHLAVLGLLAKTIGRKIAGLKGALFLFILVIVFFVWFAGASPSLIRAFIMALILIGAGQRGFGNRIFSILALTFLIHIIFIPTDAVSVGFILSYSALLGILSLGKAFSRMVEPFVPPYLRDVLSASAGAQLATAPFVAVTFGCITPIALLSSCIVAFPVSVFLVCGLLLTICMGVFPATSNVCGIFLNVLYQGVAIPVRFFSRVPPLPIEGMPAKIFFVLISFVACLTCIYFSAIALKRRSADDNFAQL